MKVYGKAVLISVAAVVVFLIAVLLASEDRHFSDRTHAKIMAVLQTACASALAALAVSFIVYIVKMM